MNDRFLSAKQNDSFGPEASAPIADCIDAFMYSAVQKPVTALAQLVDKFANTSLAQKTNLISAPDTTNLVSGEALAEQVASGVGAAIPYLVTAIYLKPAKELFSRPLLKLDLAAPNVASLNNFSESVSSGFVYGFVLTPSSNQSDFWSERLKSGVTNGVMMASLHLFSNKLGQYTGATRFDANFVTKTLNSGLAGIGAGVISVEADSLLTTGRLPEASALGKSALAMGLTGGVLGLAGGSFFRLNDPKSSFSTLQEFVARNHSETMNANNHYLGHLVMRTPYKWPAMALQVRRQRAEQIEGARPEDAFPGKRLKLSDFTPAQRVDLVTEFERLSHSRLAAPETIADFTNKMTDAGRNWQKDDITGLVQKVDEASTRYIRLVEEMRAKGGLQPQGDSTLFNRLFPGRAFPDQPQDLKAVRELSEAKLSRIQVEGDLETVLDRRTNDIQHALNSFLFEQGLPTINVIRSPAIPGQAFYQTGTIGIHDNVLTSPTLAATTAGLVFHELVHLEQDNMMIRWMSDNMEIGKTFSQDELNIIKSKLLPTDLTSELKEADWAEIDDFITQTIRLRGGQKLSTKESQRAMKLDEAHSKYFLAPWQDQLDNLEAARRELSSVLGSNGVESAEHARSIIVWLNNHPIFETMPKPVRRLIDQVNSADSAAPNETVLSQDDIRLLNDTIGSRQRSLVKQITTLKTLAYRRYMDNAMEREAYPSGMLAQFIADIEMEKSAQ